MRCLMRGVSNMRYLVRGVSSRARRAAIETLGCAPDATRNQLRDAFYRLAKEHHPDAQRSASDEGTKMPAWTQAAAKRFSELARAWTVVQEQRTAEEEKAFEEEEEEEEEEEPPDVDPLQVWFRVEKERSDAMHEEILAAAQLSQGGLDKGGLWMMAQHLVDHHERDDEVRREEEQSGKKRR